MSSFTNTNISNTNTAFASAFKEESYASSQEHLKTGTTWNGDTNYSSLGLDWQSKLLELDQKMVLPEDCRKTATLDVQSISLFDSFFNQFIQSVQSKSDVDRAYCFNIMFRYLFYLRSVRVAGKKSRLLFYYLFDLVESFLLQLV